MTTTSSTPVRRRRSLRRAAAVLLALGVLVGGAATVPDATSDGAPLAKLITVEETITF
ncbi:hypothetical protein [Blastococcus brunescens]|uniref:Uncharacterized protein n=1 Tax=Blastococcus brunescens TaxID=1564165 RepID=A0ABZ1AYK9_9ACTN|nr:hypothetical protein [Blastococcus sp. BMG 8361]WRL63021.1 hypothetical protein U6N30_24710 [Blastococcus sp. BMG 8361]